MEAQRVMVRAHGSAQIGPDQSLRASIGRYLFGPDPAPRAGASAALAEIRRLRGMITPADVMRVTGRDRRAAEALLCRLAARHDGDVAVAGQAVLYRFPALTTRPRPRPLPVWDDPRALEPVTGNDPRVDLTILFVNLLVIAASGVAILRTLAVSAAQPALALIPFLLSLLALALPMSRLAGRRSHRTQVARENGRRALLRAVLDRPPGQPLGAHALSHAWVAGSGRAIRSEELLDEVRALGGEPDVDEDARLQFRFPDLDHEARAVAALRAAR
jgi:hypothetical protein